MGPPKVRIHSKTSAGKLKTLPKLVPTTSTQQTEQTHDDAEERFALELVWCVQRLEESLNSGKLNQKQTEDTQKTLKVLRSDKQPIIRKRQLMRTTFGDYRAKMLEDEKNFALDPATIKFDKPSTSKSFFVKKSAFLQTGKEFKFNFPLDDAAMKEDDVPVVPEKLNKIVPCGNSFRFNFHHEEIEE